MKNLKEAFVIVKLHYESSYDFIQDGFISFNKEEIDLKCSQLNDESNSKWKANHDKKRAKRKVITEYNPIIIFGVKDLATAIEKHRDGVADYHTERGESY